MVLSNLLLKCISCDGPFLQQPGQHLEQRVGQHYGWMRSFPLCQLCRSSLVEAPDQCPLCGGTECSVSQCLKPWRSLSGIHSFSARYLMIGNGYGVLKKWKIRGGTLFNRQILEAPPPLITKWKNFSPQRIVPIPQSFGRAWKMRGSRTEQIALWLEKELQVPYGNTLSLKIESRKNSDLQDGTSHQAQLGLKGRMLNRFHYESQPTSLRGVRRVILVDDFMTTGRTLRQAALALLNAGVEHVHCFCLGLRAQRTHLDQG
jgi:predicted amidophosphoribosyltransferase